MTRLILFNGPPAAGKSTLARRYVDEHPLALNLAHLTAGHDVAVPPSSETRPTHVTARHPTRLPPYQSTVDMIENCSLAGST
jgi:hypothetical protein